MSAHTVPGTESGTRRPGILTAAMSLAVLTAIAAIVNGIMIATGGAELVKELLVEAGVPAGISDSELDLAVQLAGYDSMDDFSNTFATRGYLALGGGVVLLVFGALMFRAGATVMRVLTTVGAALTIAFAGIILADETTSTMAALSMAAVLGSLLTIVFTWLPAVGRYAKAN